MKQMGDMLLKNEKFSEIVMGNTAIVRAMLESGVKVVTSYPGSPTPEIAAGIASLPKIDNEFPIYFEFSTNEKVATEVAFGASINGHCSCVFFKSVGLNVAADSFVQLSMMELIGGMVIILGDDPGANSSQNEQDNRHIARLSYTPIFEPANPQEAYEMFKEAVKLSQSKKMPVILRLTTHVCHGKQKVNFDELPISFFKPYKWDSKFSALNGPYVPIGQTVFPLKQKALTKIREVQEYSDKSSMNKIVDNGNRERGIITIGLPYLSLIDALLSIDVGFKKPDILKIAMPYPLPEKAIVDFLKSHKEIKIIEELDDFVEEKIKAIAYENSVSSKIIGKKDDDDWMGEYTPDKVIKSLSKVWPDLYKNYKLLDATSQIPMKDRPPQMCPGCGHRSAFYAVKQALADDDITVADIGCHSLGFIRPYEMGKALLSMGHGSSTAQGMSINNKDKKVVTFVGDSTFFHAALPGIINGVFNKHKYTLIVMENGTTAMTGHQDHPAVGHNFREITDKIQIKPMLEAMGIKHIFETDAYSQKKLKELVAEATACDGVSVIIAKHPCMLKYMREQRHAGKEANPPVSVSETCNKNYSCISKFACPSYQIREDGSVFVHSDLCIGDGSCIQTCPSKAIKPGKKQI